MTGLEYFPSGRSELMFPLLQQIFLPFKSASAAGSAIAGNNKAEVRAAPMASAKKTLAIMSAPSRTIVIKAEALQT
jgi:hypothetical protein